MPGMFWLRPLGWGWCGVMLLAAAGPAWALERHWNAGTGSWGISSNWNPAGVPTSSDTAYLDFLVGGTRGVAIVTGTGHASPISVSVTNLNSVSIGGIGVNSGSLSVGGDFIVGTNSNVGFLDVNSSSPGIVFYQGRLTVGNALRLGMSSGSGIVNQNDGIVTVNQLVRVGDRHATSRIFPGTGRYNLSGVGVLNAARLEVGYGGDSGQFACEGEFNLSGNAVLNVHPGAQVPDPKIGGGGASGVFNQTGGTFRSDFRIIDFAPGGGSGIYNYSGGTFSVPGIHFSNSSGTFNYLNGANLSVGQLQMTGGGNVLLSPGGNKTLRSTLLWVASNSAVIDLNDNDMVASSVLEQLGGQSLPTLLTRGYNGG
ncbi:MAG TPA: hypothetical protein VNL70_06225, partial [Tepidisphaeraceae bacterium]|nr:hypothetical protein [Tepidisphaeraceae bacterium]